MPSSPSHAHSHGPDPHAPPPDEQTLARRRRAVRLMLLLLVPVGLATVLGLVLLWPSGDPGRAERAAASAVPAGATFPHGTVSGITPYDCSVIDQTGRNQHLTCATVVVEVTEGASEGEFVQIDVPAEVVAYGLDEGDEIVLQRDPGTEEGPTYSFIDYARTTPVVVLAIAFAVVVGAVARLRGLAALLGLGFAFVVLLQFVLPALLGGGSPTWVTLVGASAIMFVVLYLAHGFSARTTTALVGTLFGLVLVAGLGALAVSISRLTGFSSEETLQLQAFDPTLDFSGLVIAGVVVAGLGVLNDVTITQASAVWQLNDADPAMTWRQLFARGMAIGRDHIASTVYTIVFAYAGAALPLLLLFEVYTRPAGTVLTSDVVAEEVIRTLVGGIGLVLATPVTTAVGAFFARLSSTEAGAAADRGFAALRAKVAR
ncbi:YibE/F family protein [Geodermatophilus sp. URMC 64]